jgi:hypothetical protein
MQILKVINSHQCICFDFESHQIAATAYFTDE